MWVLVLKVVICYEELDSQLFKKEQGFNFSPVFSLFDSNHRFEYIDYKVIADLRKIDKFLSMYPI